MFSLSKARRRFENGDAQAGFDEVRMDLYPGERCMKTADRPHPFTISCVVLTAGCITIADAKTVTVKECIVTIDRFCPVESIVGSLVGFAILTLAFMGGRALFRSVFRRPSEQRLFDLPRPQQEALRRWADEQLARCLTELRLLWIAHHKDHKIKPVETLVHDFLPTALDQMRSNHADVVKNAQARQILDLIAIAILESRTHSDADLIAAGLVKPPRAQQAA
jgi:hypothetical protein